MARRIDTNIDIHAPRERVWQVLSDWTGYEHWNPFVTRLDGRPVVGSRLEVDIDLNGRTMHLTPTLVAYEEGSSFRWLGHSLVRGIFDGEHGFQLEDLGEGRTRLLHTEQFTGLLAGLTLSLIGAKTEAGFVAMNEALKRRCETVPESSPSSA